MKVTHDKNPQLAQALEIMINAGGHCLDQQKISSGSLIEFWAGPWPRAGQLVLLLHKKNTPGVQVFTAAGSQGTWDEFKALLEGGAA